MKNKEQTAFILVLLLGVLLFFVCYMYVYKANVQKTTDLEASNQQLQARVDELKEFHAKMPENKEKIAFMEEDINRKLVEFPIDILEEDVIYLALRTVKQGALVGYTKIEVSEREEMGTIPVDLVAKSHIEELDEQITFKNRRGTYECLTVYSSLKDVLAIMNDGQEQLAINKLSFERNKDGLLEGNIECVYYTVDGLDKPYVPKIFKDYDYGVENLFRSLEILSR